MIYEESFGIIPLMREKGEWKVFLILHKAGRHWGFPKGRKQGSETALEAAKRELKEETDLDIEKFIQELPFEEHYQFRRHKEIVSKKTHYFPALVSGAVKLQPEEIRDGKWFPIGQAVHQLTFPAAKMILQQAFNLLNDLP